MEEIREAYQRFKDGQKPRPKLPAGQAKPLLDSQNAFKVIEAHDQDYKQYLWILYMFYVEGMAPG